MRVALVTNMPAPYRVPCFNVIHEQLQNNFRVFFCTLREPNRQWTIPPMHFAHTFLQENMHKKKDGTTFVHDNRDIFRELDAYDPDVVITGGYNPTMLYAFLYCIRKRKKHIPMSDAWALSEQHLSPIHKILRKLVFRFSSTFIACSQKGKEYYQSYKLEAARIFISHYTISNGDFRNTKGFSDRKYDLLFSGQFTERKNPLFFVDVAILMAQQKKDLRILMLGDGPLKEDILEKLKESNIAFHYGGYAAQKDLPAYYADSRLFLFPTEYDAWGVVANEAAAAGTPVFISPFSAAAGELIMDGENGYAAALEEGLWAKKSLDLLQDKEKWTSFSRNIALTAGLFTHENAAFSIIKACESAMSGVKQKS